MSLRLPYRDYSIEAFHDDVCLCVGVKTFNETREVHNLSVTFSSDGFFAWPAIFIWGISQPLAHLIAPYTLP